MGEGSREAPTGDFPFNLAPRSRTVAQEGRNSGDRESTQNGDDSVVPPDIISKELGDGSDDEGASGTGQETKKDYSMGHFSKWSMKNSFGLKPENNLLFPDSKQTDFEILGEQFVKIGESFERVFGDAQNEAKIVESVFISDLQKTLQDRKAELSTIDQQSGLTPLEKQERKQELEKEIDLQTLGIVSSKIKESEADLMEMEVETWLKQQDADLVAEAAATENDEEGEGRSKVDGEQDPLATSEDYFKSIVSNVQGFIEQRSKEDIDRVRRIFGYDDSEEVKRIKEEREALQMERKQVKEEREKRKQQIIELYKEQKKLEEKIFLKEQAEREKLSKQQKKEKEKLEAKQRRQREKQMRQMESDREKEQQRLNGTQRFGSVRRFFRSLTSPIFGKGLTTEEVTDEIQDLEQNPEFKKQLKKTRWANFLNLIRRSSKETQEEIYFRKEEELEEISQNCNVLEQIDAKLLESLEPE